MSAKLGMLFGLLFFGLFFGVGFGLLGYGLWSAWRSTVAADWPTVQGSLTRVDLVDRWDSESTTYEVEIEYSYVVAGVAYRGSRLAFGYKGSSAYDSHRQVYKRLKSAKGVNVRYDPLDPAASVLSYGVHGSIQVVIIFAITWLGFVSGFVLLMWLSSRSDRVLLRNLSVR